MRGKLFEKISSAFKMTFMILLSLQIISGCIWGVYNCTSLQMFGDTTALLKQSETLSMTGDSGVIYPALLAVVRTLTLNGPVRFYVVMYVLQLILAFVSWFIFSGKVLGLEKRLERIWFTLAVITCPFSMLCHLAVLEYSFVSSVLCLLITYQIIFMREWKNSENGLGLERSLRDTSVVSLFWLILALLRKEFILLGIVPVAALLVTVIRRSHFSKKLMNICPVILAAVFLVIIMMSDGLFRSAERPGVSDVIKRSLYYRVAWSEDLDELYQWPGYIMDIVDRGTMHAAMEDPGLVRTVFTDVVEQQLGTSGATDEMLRWAWLAFKDNKKGIVIDTATEMAGYLFAPLFSEIKLHGIGLPGYSAGIYDVIRRNAPVFTEYYLRAFSVLYCFMLPVSVAGIILSEKKSLIMEYAPVGIMLMIATVIYTFAGNNVWDHRKTLFATCMWIALFAAYAMKSNRKEEIT